MKKQGFIQGAVILIVANAISKILGAVFKIPLTYILHEEGMGIFNSAFTVYIMGLSLVTAGFGVCVAKEISSAIASKNFSYTAKITKAAEITLLILGFLGGSILFFGAHFFAYAIKEPLAEYAIRAVAPAVPAVAIGTVYKSYFQGTGNMTPTAISQVIESVFRLIIGIALAWYFSYSVDIAASGAIGGIMLGEFIATALLWILYRKNRLVKTKIHTDKSVYTTLFSFALPLMLASVVANMASVVELSVIRRSLEGLRFSGEAAARLAQQFSERFSGEDITITQAGANWLYGAYSGYAVTLFHLPTGIISTFCTSIFPYIAGASASGDIKRTSAAIRKGILTVTMLALPSAILMFFLSDELLFLLFKNTASSYMLKILALSVVPICVSGMCANALYASGSVLSPFVCSFIGCIIKIALCAVLVQNPVFHIYGVPVAAFFDFTSVMIINLIMVHKKYSQKTLVPGLLKLITGGIVSIGISLIILPYTSPGFMRIIFVSVGVCAAYFLTIYALGIRRSF